MLGVYLSLFLFIPALPRGLVVCGKVRTKNDSIREYSSVFRSVECRWGYTTVSTAFSPHRGNHRTFILPGVPNLQTTSSVTTHVHCSLPGYIMGAALIVQITQIRYLLAGPRWSLYLVVYYQPFCCWFEPAAGTAEPTQRSSSRQGGVVVGNRPSNLLEFSLIFSLLIITSRSLTLFVLLIQVLLIVL